MKFFAVLQWTVKPTPKPATRPARWHDFCRQDARFFYTYLYHCKTAKTKNKNKPNR